MRNAARGLSKRGDRYGCYHYNMPLKICQEFFSIFAKIFHAGSRLFLSPQVSVFPSFFRRFFTPNSHKNAPYSPKKLTHYLHPACPAATYPNPPGKASHPPNPSSDALFCPKKSRFFNILFISKCIVNKNIHFSRNQGTPKVRFPRLLSPQKRD